MFACHEAPVCRGRRSHGPSIRPDVVIEMNNFYTLTVYEKGAEVIRMLHTLLGEQQFQAGMKIYIQQHDGMQPHARILFWPWKRPLVVT